MNNLRKIAVFMFLAVAGFYSCKEVERFEISSDDTTPPGKPTLVDVHPLPGGAALFFTIPKDEDVISIEASYEGKNGTVIAAVSIYADSLNVLGMSETTEQTVEFYAKDRAGNKSEIELVHFTPLEPAFLKVANSLKVRPAFAALQVEWDNELEQNINVYVNLTYNLNGVPTSARRAISSRKTFDRQLIQGLLLAETEPVSVSYSVGDAYGNESQLVVLPEPLHVMRDVLLDKSKWVLPEPGTPIGIDTAGLKPVYQSGGTAEGPMYKVIDNIIENDGFRVVQNYGWFNDAFNVTVDGTTINCNRNPLWNVIIDLGDYYQLSRLVTHQRWMYGTVISELDPNNRGRLYDISNVGIYEVFYLDETTTPNEWVLINQTKIEKPPLDMSDRDVIFMSAKGDEGFMYPDDPKYTPKTRYFRYRPIAGFANNYQVNVECWALGEITLYGKR